MQAKPIVAALLLSATFAGHAFAAPAFDDFTIVPSVGVPTSAASVKIDSIRPTPVLTRGAKGQWDSVDLLNPSVIRFHGTLMNYYSGYDGKVWRTGLATSKDGITWEKYANNPVLSPTSNDWDVSYIAANGSAIVWKGKILYFYQGVDKAGKGQIGLATSTDGIKFTKYKSPVLSLGIRHTWDGGAVGDPYVIAKGGFLYLYYLGQNDLGVQRLGVARSEDGIHWVRSLSNPILDVGTYGTFDENGLGEPSIAYSPPYFYMLYTGRSRTETRNVGYAISTDGINWKKMSLNGLVSPQQSSPWNSKVICDSTLLSTDAGKWMVWFGGGDKPEPAQNLNGQVGLMTIDLTQGRDDKYFDANADWSKTPIHSTDLLRGSFTIEGDPGRRHAWVGPTSYITFPASAMNKGGALQVNGWVPAAKISAATKSSEKDQISVVVNGKSVASKEFTTDDAFEISVPVDTVRASVGDNDFIEVTLQATRSFVPAEVGLGPDKRRLALTVSAIGFN
ncbi:hypothetical protein [Paraburkholderia caribensis]|uniref:glycoside hydrolase family 130 protein n=1 Tax=Paraburkholderia caribensis TaxID=75105 RepID=UPI0034D25F0A